MCGSIIDVLGSEIFNHSVKDLEKLITVVTLAQQVDSNFAGHNQKEKCCSKCESEQF